MAGELEDARSELRFLTEALRAHAEWQQACGTGGLPPASRERESRETLDEPHHLPRMLDGGDAVKPGPAMSRRP